MTPITIDFETFWTTEFSLSKISFIEYIQSPEFEVISVAAKIGSAATEVYFGEDVAPYLRSIDWSDKACVAHNGNEFDFPLLVWTYDVHPALFVDTLALSKARHQSQVGGSLKKLSSHYNLPVKDNTVLLNTKGRRLSEFSADEVDQMHTYNKTDTDNTSELFKLLRAPDVADLEDLRQIVDSSQAMKRELLLSDMTARMICYPQLHCDTDLLDDTLVQVEATKQQQLEALTDVLGVLDAEEVRATLASANAFAQALRSFGVEPPTKISKTTGKEALALAKTDEEFTALLEHEDERVQLITSTRLGVKSTLLETRLHRMSVCAKMMGGRMPVPLAYHGATTGRWSGRIWNPQNLPRIPRNKDGSIIPKLSNALRQSLVAPPGHLIVVSDLSGIELRVNHYLWDVPSTRQLYAADPEADLYKEFAADLFGITRDQVSKDQRQLAKVAQLGLGFGAGATTFQKVAKLMGGIDLDSNEAMRVTTTWRVKYHEIVDGWRSCQQMIKSMHQGVAFSPDKRALLHAGPDKVRLPSGRFLYYPELRSTIDDRGKQQYRYGSGRTESKVYSGLMDENVVQAIARDVIAEQALSIRQATGYSPALTVHDELVYVVPEAKATAHLQQVNRIMRSPPSWLPGIVLWSEGDIAESYGAAK